MNSLLSKVILTGALFLGATSSFGAAFKVKMFDQQFRGENTIKLKQLLKDQHPGLNLNRHKLSVVMLDAKSKRGNGHVKLMVGGVMADSDMIDGREYDFNDRHRSTFDTVSLINTTGVKGAWQLQTKGNIKVRSISVLTTEISKPRPRPTPRPVGPFFTSFGEKKVDKFIVDTDTFYVNEYDVEAIRISAKDASLEVEAVHVHFDNGRVLTVREFTGYLREGSERTHYFRTRHGANIDKVVVHATSSNLIGSRGKVVLELGKEKF
jgi:hypothetical protein